MKKPFIYLTWAVVIFVQIVIIATAALISLAVSYTNSFFVEFINVDIAVYGGFAALVGLVLLFWFFPKKLILIWLVIILAFAASMGSFLAVYVATKTPHSEFGGFFDVIIGLIIAGCFSGSSFFLSTAAIIFTREIKQKILQCAGYICLAAAIVAIILHIQFLMFTGPFILLVWIPTVIAGFISFLTGKYFYNRAQRDLPNS